MSDYIRLLTSSSITINHIASILEENGIPTLIKDNTESGRLAGFGTVPNDVELFINKSDLTKAQEVIKENNIDISLA